MTRHASNQDSGARRGRPALGAGAVRESGGASPIAAARLRAIMATIAGTMSVDAACSELGVGRSRFHAMRRRFLEQAAGLLEPQTPGPRAPEPSAAEMAVARLQQETARLKLDLMASKVREELALAMPRLYARDKGARKKRGAPR